MAHVCHMCFYGIKFALQRVIFRVCLPRFHIFGYAAGVCLPCKYFYNAKRLFVAEADICIVKSLVAYSY